MNDTNNTSPTIPGTEGYQRCCVDCGGTMNWEWGGPITFFKCEKCDRVEPCANVVIENSKVTIEEGNKKTTFECGTRDIALKIALGIPPEQNEGSPPTG